MYMVYGYDLMYGGGAFLSGISGQGETYSNASDFYFQVVFVATAMSIVSGAVAERMKLFTFFAFNLYKLNLTSCILNVLEAAGYK